MSQDNPAEETSDTFNKSPAESELSKPTENADVTKQETQKPGQEVEIIEKPVEAEAKTEELESDDEVETVQYLELDGKEVNLDDVRQWRDGHLMQSDYTKKTTDLAEERKTFKAESESGREQLLKDQSEVSDMRDLLSALIQEDEAIDWAELKEDDPDRYIELKEIKDKRLELQKQIKSERNQIEDSPEVAQAEYDKLYAAFPEWLDEKKQFTEAHSADMKLLNNWSVNSGVTPDEFNFMMKRPRSWQITTILKASKYDALQEKGREIKAKREKVPVVTTPKAPKETDQPKSAADVFWPGMAKG